MHSKAASDQGSSVGVGSQFDDARRRGVRRRSNPMGIGRPVLPLPTPCFSHFDEILGAKRGTERARAGQASPRSKGKTDVANHPRSVDRGERVWLFFSPPSAGWVSCSCLPALNCSGNLIPQQLFRQAKAHCHGRSAERTRHRPSLYVPSLSRSPRSC